MGRDLRSPQGPSPSPPPVAQPPLREFSWKNTCPTFHWPDSPFQRSVSRAEESVLWLQLQQRKHHTKNSNTKDFCGYKNPGHVSVQVQSQCSFFINHSFSFQSPMGFYQGSNHYFLKCKCSLNKLTLAAEAKSPEVTIFPCNSQVCGKK